MDMRTEFTFVIDGESVTVNLDTWQQALSVFMAHANANGFQIDEKRRKAITEIANLGRVTL